MSVLHEQFCEDFIDQLPTLTVVWDQSSPWQTLHSLRFGTLNLRGQDSRAGGHSIRDIAPTILNAAGVTLPVDLDGRPLELHPAVVHV